MFILFDQTKKNLVALIFSNLPYTEPYYYYALYWTPLLLHPIPNPKPNTIIHYTTPKPHYYYTLYNTQTPLLLQTIQHPNSITITKYTTPKLHYYYTLYHTQTPLLLHSPTHLYQRTSLIFSNLLYTRAMPPVKDGKIGEIDAFVKEHKVSLFSKTTCGFCEKVGVQLTTI